MTKKHPPFEPIESSMLSGTHYDPNTRALTVKYKNGAVHRYDDVSMEKVATLRGSFSPGSYFNAKIKGLHTATNLDTEEKLVSKP